MNLDRQILFNEKIDILLREVDDNVDSKVRIKQNASAIDQKKAYRKKINC